MELSDFQLLMKSKAWMSAILATIFVSLGLTAAATWFVRDWEHKTWQNNFIQLAQTQRDTLSESVSRRMELIENIATIQGLAYRDNHAIDEADFYFQSVIDLHPDLMFISWLEYVPQADRPKIERQWEQSQQRPFAIREYDKTGSFVIAPQREHYFPLLQYVPLDKKPPLLGFSPTSEYGLENGLLTESLRNKSLTATDPIQRELGTYQVNTVDLMKPVFRYIKGGEQKRDIEGLHGIAYVRLNVNQLVKEMQQRNPVIKPLMDIYLFDISRFQAPRLLFASDPARTDVITNVVKNGGKIDEKLNYQEHRINAANRQWLLLTMPSAKLVAQKTQWFSVLVLTIGVVFSALLYMFLASLARHTKAVEERVSQRTKQLSKANQMLAENMEAKEKAFNALAESESRYRFLTEDSMDVIARHDLDGVCRYASVAAEKLLGYPQDEMVGHSIYPLLHKDDRELMRVTHAEIIHSPGVRTIVYRARRKDDGYVWFEASCQCIRDPDTGAPMEIHSVSRDITQRRMAEARLQENEERFRGAFEDAAIGMAIINEDGKLLRVNHSLCDITGYPREELVAIDFQSISHPADIEDSLTRMAQVVEGQSRSFHLETRFMHKDGHIVWVMVSASLVKDSEANNRYFVVQIQDITDRKRAEEALEALSNKHRLILNAAGEGIFGLDADARVTFANVAAERILGYGPDELQGVEIAPLIQHTRPDGSPYLFKDSPIFAALHYGKSSSIHDEIFWRKDNTSFPCSYVCAPIESNDAIVGAVVVFSDIEQTNIGSVARKLMRGETPYKKRIWSHDSPEEKE